MEQPKIERMLRIMQLLSGNTNYTLDEIANKLNLSRRTIFRYIDTLKSAGFVVSRIDEGVYHMTSYNKEFSELSQLVYFSREEAVVVSRLIENLSSTNAMKIGLKKKLAAVYDSTSIGDYRENPGKAEEIEMLVKAIKEKKQVELKGYESALSNKTKDYIVEPYAFTQEYVDIWAFDIASGLNKMFKISRIGQTKLLGEWEMEDRHERRPIDSFRMSGNGHPLEHVKLELTLRAKDLLVEEFPITETEIYREGKSWIWEGDINALEGIGRFILGLSHEINILEGIRLKAWAVNEGKLI